MYSIMVVAVFVAAPFYKPPATPPGNTVLHVLPDHRHGQRHRGNYGGGYIDGYYDPETSVADADDDTDRDARPIVVQAPPPPLPTVDGKKTFPTYSTIVVKGAPPDSGCTYTAVMTDDEIGACKRVARDELRGAN